ncbi:hypothetical protein A3B57_01985 [Microgenomates group bacterium RIFCSPLOWO2_01_FULL_47_10]|nr:MAG: hypothetical protein A3B57_01985 [Microgenomates group bacterium RIFCSPLOWO2_01_FULL_47_10]
MDISYLGHSCFRLRGKTATVVMDPYSREVGFSLPGVTADIVTISHDHADHNAALAVKGTARRSEPFVISAPGEYEILGTSVFGVPSFHDSKNGQQRGKNVMFVVHIDGFAVAHLGDLGHTLSDKQIEELDGVDILLCPVGGEYTIDAKEAAEVINEIGPSYVIPMHFQTPKHDAKTFSKVAPLQTFLSYMGAVEAKRADKLTPSLLSMPEETEVIVLEPGV